MWAPVSFSGPPSWKFSDSWSISAGSFTPIRGRVPAACRAAMLPRVSAVTIPRPGCTPGGRQRLLALHLDTSALAGALPVQHGQVSMFPRCCCCVLWEKPRRCLAHCLPLDQELMEDSQGLSATWGTNSDRLLALPSASGSTRHRRTALRLGPSPSSGTFNCVLSRKRHSSGKSSPWPT